MADTLAGRQLTAQHRRWQLELRAATLDELVEVWPLFDLADIDGTWPALESALLTLIRSRRRESVDVAGNYYRALRAAEGVPGQLQPVAPVSPAPALERATLRLLGPIAAKRAIAARRPKVAADTLTRLSGSVGRQVLDGGRRTLTETMRRDPAARGYRRITDSSPCDFCRDLADEGIVGDSVDFRAHDHCGCAQEPAFDAAPAPGSTQQFDSFLDDLNANVAARRGTSSGAAESVGADGFLYLNR